MRNKYIIIYTWFVIERVYSYKLLGIVIHYNLKWYDPVDLISAKASRSLHFLKMLKRSSLTADDMLCFYTSVIFGICLSSMAH